MIPKIIHYSWISNDPYPPKIDKYMSTWKAKLSDYTFINWNRKSFDFNSSLWVKEAFENRNYAACSDYLRFFALYNIGGIWLDTDVEVLKSYNDLLSLPYFLGAEAYSNGASVSDIRIEASTMGAEPGFLYFKHILDWYDIRSYNDVYNDAGFITSPEVMRRLECFYDVNIMNNIEDFKFSKRSLNLFDMCFFSPLAFKYDHSLWFNATCSCTYSVHHFAGGWIKEANNFQ